MRPRSRPAPQPGPSGRNSSFRARPALFPSLLARRREAPSTPPFFALAAALVLTQSVRQARADLPCDRVGIGYRDSDRVLVHQAGSQALVHRGQLGFVAPDPDEERRLVPRPLPPGP